MKIVLVNPKDAPRTLESLETLTVFRYGDTCYVKVACSCDIHFGPLNSPYPTKGKILVVCLSSGYIGNFDPNMLIESHEIFGKMEGSE